MGSSCGRWIALLAATLAVPGTAVAGVLPESLNVKPGAHKIWDFESDREGWDVVKQISGMNASNGCLRGTATGTDPYFHNPDMSLDCKGSAGVAVRIWLSATGPLQVFWENENGTYSGSRMASTTVTGNQWATVWFDLSSNPEWDGKTIKKLRIDPGSNGTAFAIDYIAILDQYAPLNLPYVTRCDEFATGLGGWVRSGDVTDFSSTEGRMVGKSTGTDPYVKSPAISHSNQGGVMVHMRSNKPTALSLYWSTTTGGYSNSRKMDTTIEGGNFMQAIKFDLRNHPEWQGKTITGLRLDTGTSSGIEFQIDNITLMGVDAFADADGDLLTTVEEAYLRTDPAQRNSVAHRITEEKWVGNTFYSTNELVNNRAFHEAPRAYGQGTLETANLFDYVNEYGYFATRHRGYLTAPVSGNYRFWVTGACGVQLLLSDSASKYGKRLIAQINPELGTGYGVPKSSVNLWDVYDSQMSGEIYLEAGEKYYLEALQTAGHVGQTHLNIAWALPGEGRKPLVSEHIDSYYPTADDADDDYLPDAWEVTYGLNSLDNGFADIERQGERGDFDGDGLCNLEEYLLGTNPASVDTDGDGISDFTEVRISDTDVLVSNSATSTVVSTVDILNHQGSNVSWTPTSGGMVAAQFRGWIEWDFSVPSDGIWILDLETALRGTPRIGDTIGFDTAINGTDTGRRTLTYGPGGQNTLRLVTPYLTQGSHRLHINIDNLIARRTVEILALNVLSPSGPDTNSNGIVDWIEAILVESDHVTAHSLTSKTSPFCLEGHSMVVSSVVLNGSGVSLGIDDNHWFKNINLDPALATAYTATFASGILQTGEITWETTDIITSPNMTIRAGDTLKLGADFASGSGDATITIGAQTYTVTGSGTALHTFGTQGTYTVTASRTGVASESFNVTVRGAAFSNLPPMVDNALAIWTLDKTLVSPSLTLEPGKGLRLGAYVSINSTTYTRTLYPSQGGRLAVAARVGAGGPIAGLAEFSVTGFSDSVQNDLTTTMNIPGNEDYYLVTTPVVFTDLPPGGSIVVTIYRSGVMFLDGTSTKTFTESDLSNGILNLEFLFQKGLTGGYCHYVSIFDAAGNLVTKR